MQFENYIWVRLRERNLVRFGMPDRTYGYGYDSELTCKLSFLKLYSNIFFQLTMDIRKLGTAVVLQYGNQKIPVC